MEFGANKTPVEVIRERAFRGIYFRDIYSVNGIHLKFDKFYSLGLWIKWKRFF